MTAEKTTKPDVTETKQDEMAEELSAPEATFRKLMDVNAIMRELRHRKMQAHGLGSDPTRGRGRILALLRLTDGVATKDMAQVIGVRVSSLNETLAKLEKDGLIQRVPSAEDKRVMLVSLTDKGRKQAPKEDKLPDRLFADFSDDELAQLGSYLDRMTKNLEVNLGEDAQEFLENMREARKAFFEQHKEHGPGHGPGCGEHGPGGHGRGHGCGGHHGGPGHGHGPHRGPRHHECCPRF